MATIDILSRLDGVRQAGEDRWVARCPAHHDLSPSLSIRNAGDRWLLHCFAGCEPLDICRAIGIKCADLFHDRMVRPRHTARAPHIPAGELLELLEHEFTIAIIILADVLEGRMIGEIEWARLAQAVARISEARRA